LQSLLDLLGSLIRGPTALAARSDVLPEQHIHRPIIDGPDGSMM
jgi:hypothetical protein